MKKALISPNEIAKDCNNVSVGVRVCEVMNTEFEVAEPLFWVDCEDRVVADLYYYNNQTQTIIEIQPYASWVWNESTQSWEAPIPYPNDGKNYYWDESTLSWVQLPN